VDGVSVSSGTVSGIGPAPTPPPDLPSSGYAWSFSGDTTPITDLMGSIAGSLRSYGTAAGTIGLIGNVSAGSVLVGSVEGRQRIREEDDLEVLSALGLL
jgi:hypothetical protein